MASFIRRILGHSVAKSTLIVLAGSMVANFFAYLYHLIVGRILGPEKYGELAALFSLIYILNVPTVGLQTILTKYFSRFKALNRTGESKSLFFLASQWTIIFEIIGFVGLLLALRPLADFLHIASRESFVWLYFIFATYLLSIIELSSYQAYQLFFLSNVLTNTGAILRLGFGAIGAFFGVGMTLLSNVISNILMYIIGLFPLRFILRSKTLPVTITKRHVLGYSIPTFITALGMVALYSQDVILVKHFFSARDAGIYSSLSVLGKVIFYASSALTFVLFPVVAERNELKSDHKRIVFMGLGVIAVISALLSLFYFMFPQLVVDIFFGRAFYEAIPYVGYFGLFISFFSLSSLLSNVCLASERTNVWILTAAAAAAQFIFIWTSHSSLFTVIGANMTITAALFLLLLLYYGYAKGRA